MSKSVPQHSIVAVDQNRLSGEFRRLAELCEAGGVTYFELTNTLTNRSHALLTFLLSVPFLQPIPLPGVSILFGAAIVMAGLAMAFNMRPWWPKRLMQRQIPAKTMGKVFRRSAVAVSKMERFVKPRGAFVARNLWVRRLTGLTIAICGGILALPLPPGTNFPPAFAILCLSVAILEFDGLLMFFGYIIFTANVFLFGAIATYGWDQVRLLLQP